MKNTIKIREGAHGCVERRSPLRVLHADDFLPQGLIEALWHRPFELSSSGEVLRQSAARRTVKVFWGGRCYVLKHYVERSRRHTLKQLVLPSRASAAWRASHRMADNGITTPRPVACVENRWGPLRRDSFLMYPYIEGETLRQCLANEYTTADPHFAPYLWRQLVTLWQRLRELRISLGDANTGNFVVAPQAKLWVIDLDEARFHISNSAARRMQQRSWRQLLRSPEWKVNSST